MGYSSVVKLTLVLRVESVRTGGGDCRMDDVICIDASRFSKQRQLVMGIAALMIYFAHAYAIVPVDGVIAKLFSFGNLGVDIFLFASGFGMYYSLRNGGGRFSLRQFYWKRFVRVGVPFLLISVPVYLLLDMLISRDGGCIPARYLNVELLG